MHSKNFAVNIKAAGPDDGLEDGQFRGYASVFGNVDSYGDIVVKGAFASTLEVWKASGDPIPLLWGHDMNDPFSNIGSVDAVEDDHGLLVQGTFDLENPKAAQVYRLVKGRRVGDMSFAYDVIDSGQVEVDGEKYNELRELRLYEASIVPIGANQETEILAVKSNAEALADGVKAGRAISAKNEGELREARDAIDRVLAALATDDQEKASGHGGYKDEEPVTVKSEITALNPSVNVLASLIQIEERKAHAYHA